VQTNTLFKSTCLIMTILLAVPIISFTRTRINARRELAGDKLLMTAVINEKLDGERFVLMGIDILTEVSTSCAKEYAIRASFFAAGVTRLAGRVTGTIGISLEGERCVAYDRLCIEFNEFGRKLREAALH